MANDHKPLLSVDFEDSEDSSQFFAQVHENHKISTSYTSTTSQFNRKFSLNKSINDDDLDVEDSEDNSLKQTIRDYIVTRRKLRCALEVKSGTVALVAFLLVLAIGVLFPRNIDLHVVEVVPVSPFYGNALEFGVVFNVTWQVSNENNFPLILRSIELDLIYSMLKVGNISGKDLDIGIPAGGRSVNVTVTVDIYVNMIPILESVFNNTPAQTLLLFIAESLANDLIQGTVHFIGNGSVEISVFNLDIVLAENITSQFTLAGIIYPPIPPDPPIPPIPPFPPFPPKPPHTTSAPTHPKSFLGPFSEQQPLLTLPTITQSKISQSAIPRWTSPPSEIPPTQPKSTQASMSNPGPIPPQ